MKKILAFFLLITLALFANAASSSTPNTDSIMGVTAVIESVIGTDLMARFVSGGVAISSNLIPYAKIIAGSLALAHFSWQILINMINGNDILAGVIEDVLFAAVVVFLLSIYPTLVSDVIELGKKTMDLGAAGGISGAVSRFINSLFGQMGVLFKEAVEIFKDVSGIWDFLSKSIDIVVALILALVALVFGIIALAEVLSVVFLGPVVVGIAISVGPLFVATMATSWTRRWFDQWINFFINGAMLTALMAIVLTLVSNVLMSQVATASAGTSLTGGALAMSIFAMSLGKIISSVPSFADALFPGRTSAGSAKGNAKEAIANGAKTAFNLAARGFGKK